ncbi:hypothetical protein E2I00_009856, partial [Balaenoptera physalus]
VELVPRGHREGKESELPVRGVNSSNNKDLISVPGPWRGLLVPGAKKALKMSTTMNILIIINDIKGKLGPQEKNHLELEASWQSSHPWTGQAAPASSSEDNLMSIWWPGGRALSCRSAISLTTLSMSGGLRLDMDEADLS